MNKFLWASKGSGDDHFVTQWNGLQDNTVRDFVDYDSNLIAAAHGVVDVAAQAFDLGGDVVEIHWFHVAVGRDVVDGALAQAALQRNVRRSAFVVRPQARLTLCFGRLRGRPRGYVTLR